ncbi:HIT family protein [Phototrophicus methaneseepsis]|uniref:HIT family protein n=1 Tax=Phototrophicus methaneseepsis TaxID=2710758 RepID=A0A7S8E700_9CHLR|nr:HIT family protein [Phototrophicus methaneseepsis]QPC81502.1 HIT family protein [Phototrophicus methaneseepsis]
MAPMIYSHAPAGYDCPFCRIVAGDRDMLTQPEDIILQTETVTAFIASHWWPRNRGHVLIIPNEHIENLYAMPFETGAHILATARRIALAFKAVYHCDGISTRQHNEPAGNQEVFHYHLHVFPRYKHDLLYMLSPFRHRTTPQERLPYAEKLRRYLTQEEESE